jgi:hypothetical protein
MNDGSGGAGWFRRLFRGGGSAQPLDSHRQDLVVVVACFDDSEACSATLERGAAVAPRLAPEADAVLRYHLRLPADAVERVADIAAQDSYSLAGRIGVLENGLVAVVLQRVQRLDALHCSQERSRMVGLAQRHGGHVVGWDALQPDPADSGAAS